MRRILALAIALGLTGCAAPQIDEAGLNPPASADNPVAPAQTPGYNRDRNAYFGDMHIHTRNSFDAYIFNVRRTPDDAYRFAKGETLRHPAEFDMTIAGGPLDFYTVTDHAEYLGVLPAMNTPGHPLSEVARAKDMFSSDPEKIQAAFQGVGTSVRTGERIEDIYDESLINSVWADTVEAANQHNEPGKFTTFAAFEFTSVGTLADDGTFGGANLHRNVFFRGEAPVRVFSTLDSTNPEDLWDWMDGLRKAGIESIAIPHNSNVSDGQMFRLETFDGAPLSADYAAQRMRNEPLVEVTQVKGTSETHPDLSPNDEWANFEIYDRLLGVYTVSKTDGSYVRQAYQRGLELAEERGFNPFHFGLVGASDSHVAGGSFAESDYWSKIGIVDGTPVTRGSIPANGARDWSDQPDTLQVSSAREWFSRWSASGLTGVWAEENTRDSIFDAFRRKETFATTGPRIKVRFFAADAFGKDILKAPDLVARAYKAGVSMGSDLMGQSKASPEFLVWAQRDPGAAPLQRVQIVKVTSQTETVYDVACASGAPDAATHRCADNGAGVDLATCTPTGDGAADLRALWRDPAFRASEHAAYYVRVLENPTCRWSTWEAIRNGTPPRLDVAATIQERAYTSPIWYMPAN